MIAIIKYSRVKQIFEHRLRQIECRVISKIWHVDERRVKHDLEEQQNIHGETARYFMTSGFTKMVAGALRTEPLYSGGEKLSCYAALEIT